MQDAARALIADMAKHDLGLRRFDWTGRRHTMSHTEAKASKPGVGPSLIPDLCARFPEIAADVTPGWLPGVGKTLFAGGPYGPRVDKTQRLAQRRNNPQKPLLGIAAIRQAQMVRRPAGTSLPSPLRLSTIWSRLRPLFQVKGHTESSFCVLFDCTGHRIVTGADDKLVKVWSSRTGRLLATLRGHDAEIMDLALSPDGLLLASSDVKGTIRAWAMVSGAPVAVLLGHDAGSQVLLRFSPSPFHRYLVSTGSDGTMRFWKWEDGLTARQSATGFRFISPEEPVTIYTSNENVDCGCKGVCKCQVHSFDFSSGGNLFAAGGTDAFLYIYALASGSPELAFVSPQAPPGPGGRPGASAVHTKCIRCIRFSNDGSRLFTAAYDGKAMLCESVPMSGRCFVRLVFCCM